MTTRKGTPSWRPWAFAAVVSLAANLLFLLLAYSSSLIPREVAVDRVRAAFASGDLTTSDYRRYDTRLGFHQYNDCNILQMMSNEDASVHGRALGPWLIYPAHPADEACGSLRALAAEGIETAGLVRHRYTRYWHGYMHVSKMLLALLDVAAIRYLLRLAVYASVGLVLVAGFRERLFLPLTTSIAIVAATAWGLPSFGQGLSHGYVDAAVMLGIALLVIGHRRLNTSQRLLAFCAAWGSVVAYFDMLTGGLPVAAGLLFPAAYLVSTSNWPDDGARRHLSRAMASVFALALGAFVTVIAHLLLVLALVRPTGLGAFVDNLRLYTRIVDSSAGTPGLLETLLLLGRRGIVLTQGSQSWLLFLYSTAALAWIGAAVLSMLRRCAERRVALLAFIVGAASVPAWTALMQTHTSIHAGFMARILIVPICLGFAAFWWQIAYRSTPSLRSGAIRA